MFAAPGVTWTARERHRFGNYLICLLQTRANAPACVAEGARAFVPEYVRNSEERRSFGEHTTRVILMSADTSNDARIM